jgi:hypothetical protein
VTNSFFGQPLQRMVAAVLAFPDAFPQGLRPLVAGKGGLLSLYVFSLSSVASHFEDEVSSIRIALTGIFRPD